MLLRRHRHKKAGKDKLGVEFPRFNGHPRGIVMVVF
jgi:hypothetical protein